MFRRSTKGKVTRRSADSKLTPAMFDKIYNLAKNTHRNPDDTDWLVNMAYNIDVSMNGTTPITMLACEGNHQAVEFLLSCGSDPKHAVTGYAAAGYLLDAEKARDLLANIQDPEIRESLAQAAFRVVDYDVMSALRSSVKIELP